MLPAMNMPEGSDSTREEYQVIITSTLKKQTDNHSGYEVNIHLSASEISSKMRLC